MSRDLRVAFLCEGNTDQSVIPTFIRKVVAQSFDDVSLVVDSQLWNGRGEFLQTCVLLIRQAQSQHDLIVFHTDADGPNENNVRQVKIEPLSTAIQEAQVSELPLVWAIPVHAVEAWLLVSPEAIARALTNNPARTRELSLPRRPDQIHRQGAKDTLAEAVYTLLARTQSQRARIDPPDYYEAIANEIELADLRRLPAFVIFEQRLTEALGALGYVVP